MKIFRMGIEGGKPGKGKIGVQPEWFFKGVGTCVVAPGALIAAAGLCASRRARSRRSSASISIDAKGRPWRIGYSLGNEFSDHVTEAENYLYLAHSKLRACALGPELLIGELPPDVRGKTRIRRKGKVIWEDDFLSGEDEHVPFHRQSRALPLPLSDVPPARRSPRLFLRRGGAELHAAGIQTEPGDEFEIDVPVMGKPLRNRMDAEPDEGLIAVKAL